MQVRLTKGAGHRRPLARGTRRLHEGDRHGGIGARADRGALPARGGRADAGRDGRREGPQGGTLTVTRRERERGEIRQGQDGGQAAEGVGLAAAEGVGCDIRITEGDHRDAPGCQRAQQCQGGLGRLLQVVDDDEPQGRGPLPQFAALDGRDRVPGELGLIEARLGAVGEHLRVLLDELRGSHPLRMPVRAAQAAQLRDIHVVLRGPGHQLTQLGAEGAQPPHLGTEVLGPARAGPLLEVTLDEGGELDILLGAADQPRR